MFASLTRNRRRRKQARFLYGRVVARARAPHFYREAGVPDDFAGRFEMLTLHLYLLDRHLRQRPDGGALSQDVFDRFIDDMDAAQREAAVGDQAVPKRLAKMTRIVHGQVKAFDAALRSPDPHGAIAEIVAANLFGGREPQATEAILAGYLLAERERLKGIADEEIFAGPPVFDMNAGTERARELAP